MNQVVTLISSTRSIPEMGAIGADLQRSGLVKEVRVSVAGPALVLIDTDDFTKPEYKAYAGMLKQFLKSQGIDTISPV